MADGARPNLLLFISDQHNPHLMGCAGDRVAATPHLDRLAAEGVRCSHAYCGSPLCVPSRSTMLTGQSCSALEVWTLSDVLPSAVPTFAHALAAAGYDTILCGRMHFVGADQRHGFRERIIGDVTGALLTGLPPDLNGQSYESTATAGPGRTGYQAYDAAVTAKAVQWLRERATSSTDRRPSDPSGRAGGAAGAGFRRLGWRSDRSEAGPARDPAVCDGAGDTYARPSDGRILARTARLQRVPGTGGRPRGACAGSDDRMNHPPASGSFRSPTGAGVALGVPHSTKERKSCPQPRRRSASP